MVDHFTITKYHIYHYSITSITILSYLSLYYHIYLYTIQSITILSYLSLYYHIYHYEYYQLSYLSLYYHIYHYTIISITILSYLLVDLTLELCRSTLALSGLKLSLCNSLQIKTIFKNWLTFFWWKPVLVKKHRIKYIHKYLYIYVSWKNCREVILWTIKNRLEILKPPITNFRKVK